MMLTKQIRKIFTVLLLTLTAPWALSQTAPSTSSTQEVAADNLVSEVALPEPFQVAKLVPFSPYAYGSIKFFVDPQSIRFIKDDEVRITVVTLNESGRYQGIYLGFYCNDFEYRQYGFYEDGNWRRPKDSSWRPIPKGGYNQYVSFLARYSTCKGSGPSLNKYDILDGLQGPKAPVF